MPVRTKTLAVATVDTTLQAVYTCPPGETAILKSVALAKLAAGAVSLDLTILRGATARVVFRHNFSVTSEVTYDDLWLVLMPGDVLRAQTNQGTVTMWGSGTELEGVAD